MPPPTRQEKRGKRDAGGLAGVRPAACRGKPSPPSRAGISAGTAPGTACARKAAAHGPPRRAEKRLAWGLGECAILVARRGRVAAFCALRGKVACLNLRTSSTSNVSSKVRRCGAPLFRVRRGLLRAKTDARKGGASFRGPCTESGRARACVCGAQAEGASPFPAPGPFGHPSGRERRTIKPMKKTLLTAALAPSPWAPPRP